ncbi:MAG: hypothetical protein WHS38_00320 [Thermodesulforhabdaceae bacterium]
MKVSVALLVAYIVVLWGCFSSPEGKEVKNVGGACNYKSYPGVAKVVSVKKVGPGRIESEDEFEVKFVFHSNLEIKEPFALNMIKGDLPLLLEDGSLPKKWFLEKYRIREGSAINCELMVIELGSCTPVFFVFPWSKNNL